MWAHRHRLHIHELLKRTICERIGTVYTCMNSWKEPFNTYNFSMRIFSLFWLLLNWFQACFQSDTIVVSRWWPPYCFMLVIYKKSSSSYERIISKQVTVLLSNQKARKQYTLILLDTNMIFFFQVNDFVYVYKHYLSYCNLKVIYLKFVCAKLVCYLSK